jgi:HAD superfamily hydrolase (TIGR01484 family)
VSPPSPIAALGREEARAVRAVAFDIDDTLTRDGRLEREAFAALWSLADAGLVLVAATGRPLGLCDVVVRHWPVHAAVGENGGGWVWRDRTSGAFHEGYADDDATRAAALRRLDALRARVARVFPQVRVTDDQRARRVDLAFDVGEHARLDAAAREALRALIEAEGARAIVSSVHAHAFYGDHDKATGIRAALAAATGDALPDDAVLFVGDSGNDAPAFAAFSTSAAPRNVAHWLDALPVSPRYVAEASFGAGFAEIARTLLDRRADG